MPGTKLKAYRGRSIVSNSSTPNMMLTGTTINGLHYVGSTPYSVTLSYNPSDSGKIEGNEKLGRDIRTLNGKNQKKTLALIEDELEKKIKDYEKEVIKIFIGKR